MQALRFIAEPVNRRLVIDLPLGLDCGPLEIIVMPAPAPASPPKRQHDLRGSAVMADDLIAPVAEDDWDAVQ